MLLAGAFVIGGIMLSQTWTNFFGAGSVVRQEIKKREQIEDSLLILHRDIDVLHLEKTQQRIDYEKHISERDSILLLESKSEHIGAITRFLNR